jgi:polar amino acid transport system substrate-binding protein
MSKKLIFTFSALLLLISVSTQASLVAYYPLEGNAIDASGDIFSYVRLRLQPWTHTPMVLSHMQFIRRPWQRGVVLRLFAAVLLAIGYYLGAASGGPFTAAAQTPEARTTVVPGFWDPRRRPERPDLSRVTLIRFLTENDFPPFNHAGPDGNPVGFNVDLARMICEELKIACTVQMRRFDTLMDALADNRGDAVIASIAVTPQSRGRVDFSDPYYRTPARFVARRNFAIDDIRPELLEGRKVAVVSGTAHEAYLKTLFTEVVLQAYPNAEAAHAALMKGEVELMFADGISLAFWLN